MPLRLVQACCRAVPVSGAALSLMTSAGGPGSLLTASDRIAAAVEELQFDLGEGPGLDAARGGSPVLVADLAGAAGHRWPVFAATAARRGVAAVFAYPLRMGSVALGVLELYRDRAGPLDDAGQAEASACAVLATTLVLQLQSALTAAGPVPLDAPEEARIALADDRAVVHQASGIVSVSAHVGVGQALVLLRGRAYAEGRALDELAADVVTGRVLLDGTGRDHHDRPRDGHGDERDFR